VRPIDERVERKDIMSVETEIDLRALDAEVAERVMDESKPDFTPGDALDQILLGSPVASPKGCWRAVCEFEKGDVAEWEPVPYSKLIAFAWQIVVHFQQRGYMVAVNASAEGGFWTCLYPPKGGFVESALCDTAAESICRAALKTIT
jgi:hypothetical protein